MRIKIENIAIPWENVTGFGEPDPTFVMGQPQISGEMRYQGGTVVDFNTPLASDEYPLLFELLRRIGNRVTTEVQGRS